MIRVPTSMNDELLCSSRAVDLVLLIELFGSTESEREADVGFRSEGGVRVFSPVDLWGEAVSLVR